MLTIFNTYVIVIAYVCYILHSARSNENFLTYKKLLLLAENFPHVFINIYHQLIPTNHTLQNKNINNSVFVITVFHILFLHLDGKFGITRNAQLMSK